MQLNQILNALQGTDNQQRVSAENELKTARASNAKELCKGFHDIISAQAAPGSDDEKTQILSCVLLKKYFLDNRPEEKDLE